MKILKIMMVSASLLAFSMAAQAERCPAGDTGCTLNNAPEKIQERVNEGARKVLEDTNPNGRVQEVKETLEYCVDCGVEAVEEGFNRGDSGEGSEGVQ